MFQWLLRLLGLAKDEPAAAHNGAASPEAAGPTPAPAPTPTPAPAAGPQIALPSTDTAPAPWKTGHVVPAVDPCIVRRHLEKHLEELLEEAPEPGDRALVERLHRMVKADQLDLPPFPAVARELDDLLKQTSTDILQIARVVERDPGMVKRVWTHARSAMYSSPPRSLHHAVARVGLDALWRIGMSVCLNNTVFRVEGYQHEADRVRAVGIVTAEVAAVLAGEKRGNVYMAGLLHDVGRLIVLRAASEGHKRGTASPEFLEKVSDRTRTWLSVLVSGSWGLDETVSHAIAFHFDPEAAPRRYDQAAGTVKAAAIAAHATALSRAGITPSDADPTRELQALGFDPMLGLTKASEVMDALAASDVEDDDASVG